MRTQSSGGQPQNAQKQQWYADYRSGHLERSELVKMDLNALFSRAMAEKALTYLIHRRMKFTETAVLRRRISGK